MVGHRRAVVNCTEGGGTLWEQEYCRYCQRLSALSHQQSTCTLRHKFMRDWGNQEQAERPSFENLRALGAFEVISKNQSRRGRHS